MLGCGTVDSAFASYYKGPGFESSHRQTFFEHKDKIKEKEIWNGTLKQMFQCFLYQKWRKNFIGEAS